MGIVSEVDVQATLKAKLGLDSPPQRLLGVCSPAITHALMDAEPDPAALLTLLWPLVVIYALNFAVSTVVGCMLFARGDAIALVYGTVMRNLSIALAIAIGVFRAQGAEAALLIAMAYVVQVQAAAWTVRFTDRLFGPPATARAPFPAR